MRSKRPFRPLKKRSLDSDFAQGWVELGKLYRDGGKPNDAARALEQSLRLQPDDPSILARALGVFVTVEFEEAAELLGKAI